MHKQYIIGAGIITKEKRQHASHWNNGADHHTGGSFATVWSEKIAAIGTKYWHLCQGAERCNAR